MNTLVNYNLFTPHYIGLLYYVRNAVTPIIAINDSNSRLVVAVLIKTIKVAMTLHKCRTRARLKLPRQK